MGRPIGAQPRLNKKRKKERRNAKIQGRHTGPGPGPNGHDGMTVMLGGFTNVGSPNKFCRALADTGIKDLHIIANDAGNDKADGIGTFIVEGRRPAWWPPTWASTLRWPSR